MLILAVAWFVSGQANSPSAYNPFIAPPTPIGSGDTYGEDYLTLQKERRGYPSGQEIISAPQRSTNISEELRRAQTEAERISSELKKIQDQSVFAGKVYIREVRTSTKSSDEYVVIESPSSNTSEILLTGMTLKSSATGQSYKIDEGATLPYSGAINTKEKIFLPPGGRAYIITGRSPIGASFKLNTCTGYFEQYQDFTPYLPRLCPRPENENFPNLPSSISDACLDYLEGLPQCEAVPVPPDSLPRECQVFVSNNLNYTSCVSRHRNDPNFFKPEWRIYLGRSEPIWKTRRELVILSDSSGKTVNSYSY